MQVFLSIKSYRHETSNKYIPRSTNVQVMVDPSQPEQSFLGDNNKNDILDSNVRSSELTFKIFQVHFSLSLLGFDSF